ncbi:hypothetical protein GGF31_001456 [Allomyces arbusculus]|nr:hypothetical protein GGF31_001456 [Allomyces arbusculus]
MTVPAPLRSRAIRLYKELLFLGRDYPHPQGFPWFRARLKRAFQGKASLTDPAEIEKALAHADYVKREIEALYSLRKYRTMQRRYGSAWDDTLPAALKDLHRDS